MWKKIKCIVYPIYNNRLSEYLSENLNWSDNKIYSIISTRQIKKSGRYHNNQLICVMKFWLFWIYYGCLFGQVINRFHPDSFYLPSWDYGRNSIIYPIILLLTQMRLWDKFEFIRPHGKHNIIKKQKFKKGADDQQAQCPYVNLGIATI